MGEELEAADAFLLLRVEIHVPQRLAFPDERLGAGEDLELVVQAGVLDLLAVFFEALEAFLNHHEVAEDQLGLDVLQVAHGIDGAFFVGDGGILEEAQDVGHGVDHAQAGQIGRIAQGLFGDGREIQVLDGGVRDLGGGENARQLSQARVGHLGHAQARLHGADASGFVDTGEDGEERCLAYHGQADNGCFHREIRGGLAAGHIVRVAPRRG